MYKIDGDDIYEAITYVVVTESDDGNVILEYNSEQDVFRIIKGKETVGEYKSPINLDDVADHFNAAAGY